MHVPTQLLELFASRVGTGYAAAGADRGEAGSLSGEAQEPTDVEVALDLPCSRSSTAFGPRLAPTSTGGSSPCITNAAPLLWSSPPPWVKLPISPTLWVPSCQVLRTMNVKSARLSSSVMALVVSTSACTSMPLAVMVPVTVSFLLMLAARRLGCRHLFEARSADVRLHRCGYLSLAFGRHQESVAGPYVRPRSAARATASTREVASSLERIAATWCSTVRGEIRSA